MRRVILVVFVQLLAIYRWLVNRSEFTTNLSFLPGLEGLRWNVGKMRAWLEYERAKKKVPGYKQFLKSNHFEGPTFKGLMPNVSEIPSIDKENYVKKYSIDERCVGGKIPAKGTVIDESSGSSGKPTNWARGGKERRLNKFFLSFGLHKLMGRKPLFIINAFALGPWATGMSVSMAFVEVSILKSLGPDILKITNTLQDFGSKYKYVLMGYPPFLKTLVDTADIKWADYDITFIFGGEAMSESMREYLVTKGIKNLYSSFGASDLELNIASENNTTIALRKLIVSNKKLAAEIVKHQGATPMVFQYAPFDFFIESNDSGELLISICRPGYVSPKIRYNIHDLGHVIRTPELKKILGKCGIDPSELSDWDNDLPFLFHYGRSDMSVSYFGANITPGELQEVIFKIPELAGVINSFTMQLFENDKSDKRLRICIELLEGMESHPEAMELNKNFLEILENYNQDFREASRMMPVDAKPILQFYPFGQGPFSDSDIRIKTKYIRQKD